LARVQLADVPAKTLASTVVIITANTKSVKLVVYFVGDLAYHEMNLPA